MTTADLYAFLSTQKLGVLAYGAMSNSALLGIAITPQFEIVFDTVKTSRKYPNLIARPQCSFVIGGWDESGQTVQYEGQAEELTPPKLAQYQELYFQAFPDGPERLSWPGIVYFLVRPTWIRHSDYRPDTRGVAEFTFQIKT